MNRKTSVQEDLMANTKADHDEEDKQPALVPMSEDELKGAGRELATLIHKREEMTSTHAEVRAEQKSEREKLDNKITALASTIRSQGR
jgi:hypothetical protein